MGIAKGLGMVAALGLLAAAPAAWAEEAEIAVKELPKAVVEAVKAKFPGATIKEAEKEVEDGQTIYEVELSDKGAKVEVELKADGTIVEIETPVSLESLPKTVTAALEAKYPKAALKKAEKVTKGEATEYEVKLVTAEKKAMEVTLDAQGKILEAEEDKD
jgi:uncharacterized membrane protein YkoI